MRRQPVLFTAVLAVVLLVSARCLAPRQAPAGREVTPAARVEHAPIAEMSGIAASRRYPGVFWVHNDSGDEARLFAIRTDGSVVMPVWLSDAYYTGAPVEGKPPYPGLKVDMAANEDWEDIAIDGDRIYIADTGNNGNARRDLGVYVLMEPNPAETPRARPLQWLPVAYPDQDAYPGHVRHFDCEALFVHRGKVCLLTKHRAPDSIDEPEGGTNLYVLDTARTDRVNVLRKADSRDGLGGWVTGADMSPDGRTLAVVCHAPVASVWLFDAPARGDRLLSGRARRLVLEGAKQCEAVCFDGNDTLVVTNEQREVFRIPVADVPPVAPSGER